MYTKDLIVRYDGPAKLDIETKSDWLLFCFIFVTKLPGGTAWLFGTRFDENLCSANIHKNIQLKFG